jgi:hypothetical protein
MIGSSNHKDKMTTNYFVYQTKMWWKGREGVVVIFNLLQRVKVGPELELKQSAK